MNNKRFLSLSTVGFPLFFIAVAITAVLTFTHHAEAEETAVQSTEKILVSISNDTVTWTDSTLYTIDPDGTNQTKLYDFKNHPKFTTGGVSAPRISKDGKHIYFHSKHAYVYTPAGQNAFRIASDGSGLDQITPGEKSGIWGPTGNSTVSGWVERSNGVVYANAPVYLEGMSMVYSGNDGSFSFQNVPAGARWLVAYRPGDTPFDAEPITVYSGINNIGLHLIPNSTWRSNFKYPVAYGNRIYYRTNKEVQWTDLGFSNQHTVYTPSTAGCTTTPTVDAFDVAPTSGRLAVFDYEGNGCNENAGIYITNKDGGNKQILLNMWNDPNWDVPMLPVEIFWSPDESKIAFQGRYEYNYSHYDVLVIIDTTTGQVLGLAYPSTVSTNITLHGWNPAADWILYSSYDGDPKQSILSKLKVNTDGTFDYSSYVALISNQPIDGATWGNLNELDKVYLPMIVK